MPKPLQLQEKELHYLQDTDFLPTKQRLMQELQTLLLEAQRTLEQHQAALLFPPGVWELPAKISRGENYEGLPYLVLDYPRIFRQETTFAFRCMFWWGHGFSCTLQLGGAYWQHYQKQLLAALPALKQQEQWYVSLHESPWEYHYRPDNYVLLSEHLQHDPGLQALRLKPFFKISCRLPLEQYQLLPQFCLENLQKLSLLMAEKG